MSDVASIAGSTALQASAPLLQQATVTYIDMYGYHINTLGFGIAFIVLVIFGLFYRIQSTQKLDFTDMITKDGRSVSLTKVLQLVGGITSTWIMIKLTLTGGMTEALFGLYLTYVGAIEGYSKFVSAKYGYTETSVRDAQSADTVTGDPSLKSPKV